MDLSHDSEFHWSLPQSLVLAGCLSILACCTVFLRKSSVSNIAGPPSPSWIFGNMKQLMFPPSYGAHEFSWLERYGPVYRIKGCFGQDRLIVADPVALQHIINNESHFGSGPELENLKYFLYGTKSLTTLKGETHKRIRSAMNVGFSAAAVRTYEPVFKELAQALSQKLEDASSPTINLCPLLSITTLGAVSQVVLGRSTDQLGHKFMTNNFAIVALTSSQSPSQLLADAFSQRLPTWVLRLASRLPIEKLNIIRTAKALSDELGQQVVQERLAGVQNGIDVGSDVYGLLVEKDHSVSSEEIAQQTGILMVAGEDTTANTVALALMELANNPALQAEVRAEIHTSLGRDGFAYDTMPLVDACVKEAIRMYPAVSLLEHIALQDTVIPTSEKISTFGGESVSGIAVQKGQSVTLALGSYQRLSSRWGNDPHNFRPSRWLDGTVVKENAIGPYANLMAFGGGSHICLGWRFAQVKNSAWVTDAHQLKFRILEMKVLLSELISKFSFSLSQDTPIEPRSCTTVFPVTPDGKKGAVLCVKRVL